MKKKISPSVNISQLAKELGRSRRSARRYMEHPDWPFGQGPWKRSQLAEILRWAAATVRSKADAPSMDPFQNEQNEKKLAAQVRLMEARLQAAQAALERDKAMVVPVEEVNTEWQAIGAFVCGRIQPLERAISAIAIKHGMPAPSPSFSEEVRGMISDALVPLSKATPA